MPRLSVRHLMLGVAVLAPCMALARVNIALATIAACIAILTLVRTSRTMRRRRASGLPAGPWRWLGAGLESLLVSTAIIGSADRTFLLVYGLVDLSPFVYVSHRPPPELDGIETLIAALFAVAVGSLGRRFLRDRPAGRVPPTEPTIAADPAREPADPAIER